MFQGGEMVDCGGERGIVVRDVPTRPAQELSYNENGNAAVSYMVAIGAVIKIVPESELKRIS